MRAHVAADAALNTNRQRNFELSAGHVMQFGSMVDELVHCQSDEVDEHNFHHRPEPGGSRADGESHYCPFADGCVDDAVLAESLSESVGDTKWSAQRDVFAKKIDRRVAAHLFVQAGTDCLQVCLLGHNYQYQQMSF